MPRYSRNLYNIGVPKPSAAAVSKPVTVTLPAKHRGASNEDLRRLGRLMDTLASLKASGGISETDFAFLWDKTRDHLKRATEGREVTLGLDWLERRVQEATRKR